MDNEFKDIDKLIEELKDEEGVYIVADNPARQAQMDFSVMAIRKALAGSTNDYDIKVKMDEDVPGFGYVTIEAKNIIFTDIKNLSRAVNFSTNVEICPLKNGKVRMGFGFHGLKDILERVN